jgi:hypothetical protein
MRATQMHLLIQVRKRRGVTTSSVDSAAVGIDLSWPRRARSSAKDTVHHELVPLVPSFATSLVLIKGIIGIIC